MYCTYRSCTYGLRVLYNQCVFYIQGCVASHNVHTTVLVFVQMIDSYAVIDAVHRLMQFVF